VVNNHAIEEDAAGATVAEGTRKLKPVTSNTGVF
jgi:hypothetical protein